MNNHFPLYSQLLNYSAIALTPDVTKLTVVDYETYYPIFSKATSIMAMFKLHHLYEVATPLNTIEENFEYFDKLISDFSPAYLKLDYVVRCLQVYYDFKSTYMLYKQLDSLLLKSIVSSEFTIKLSSIFRTEQMVNPIDINLQIKYKKGVYTFDNKTISEANLKDEIISLLKNKEEFELSFNFIKIVNEIIINNSALDDLENNLANINLQHSNDE